MTIPPHRVFASARALRDADRLLPGRVLELAVEDAIVHGRKFRRPLRGVNVELASGERFVVLDARAGAIIAKRASPLTSRPAWLVTKLVPL